MTDEETTQGKSSGVGDIRGLLRQLVTPVIEQVETRVSAQIDEEVAARIDDLLATRMATIDRAIGAMDRQLNELTARLDRLEQQLGSDDGPSVEILELEPEHLAEPGTVTSNDAE